MSPEFLFLKNYTQRKKKIYNWYFFPLLNEKVKTLDFVYSCWRELGSGSFFLKAGIKIGQVNCLFWAYGSMYALKIIKI